MKTWKCMLVMELALFLLAPGVFADPITLGTEGTNGFIDSSAPITVTTSDGSTTGIIVASDGEAFFNPFNYTVNGLSADTSDGIQFNVLNVADLVVTSSSSQWVNLFPGQLSTTYVLPLSGARGNENEQASEPVGVFNFNYRFTSGTGTYLILGADGVTISDIIEISNNGPNGNGQVVFTSDLVPIPGSVWLMGSGLLSLLGLRRLRKT